MPASLDMVLSQLRVGLMTEALQLTIDFAFKQLNLHRLMANYSPTNVRSAKLLVRLNFVERLRTGLSTGAWGWQDHVLTLTNLNWTSAALSSSYLDLAARATAK